MREDSSFSEEKEAKRLLCPGPSRRLIASGVSWARRGNKSFLVLFFKKEHS
jgi:hypothetical protein